MQKMDVQNQLRNPIDLVFTKVAQKVATQHLPILKFNPKTLMNKLKLMDNIGVTLDSLNTE